MRIPDRSILWAVTAAAVISAAGVPVGAHSGHGDVDGRLVEAGERLLIGGYEAPQPGPLVVVPYRDGPLPCGAADASGFRLPVGAGAWVTWLANATHIEAGFDLPGEAFVAFAVDTRTASRALLAMQEHEVSRHALAADFVAADGTGRAPDGIEGPRRGVLGIPYAAPGAGMHDFGHGLEWGGIGFAYYDDEAAPWVTRCASGETGHVALQLRRDTLRATLAPGNVVHAVALVDPSAPSWPPHPLDGTALLQANLYLARPGEDPQTLATMFAGRPDAGALVPLAAVVAAAVAVVLVAARRM